MDFLKSIGYTIWFMIIVVILLAGGVAWKYYGEPWAEQARFNVMRESQSFRQGNARVLFDYKVQWDGAAVDSEVRKTIKGAVLQMASNWRDEDIPSDLRGWVSDLRSGAAK